MKSKHKQYLFQGSNLHFTRNVSLPSKDWACAKRLIVVVPPRVQQLPHLHLEVQVVVVAVKVEVLLTRFSLFSKCSQHLRIRFKIVEFPPIVHIAPVRLLLLCLGTGGVFWYPHIFSLWMKWFVWYSLCQSNILCVSVLGGHHTVALHKLLRVVHQVVPESGIDKT